MAVLFGADVDHMGLTGGVEMGEFGHEFGLRAADKGRGKLQSPHHSDPVSGPQIKIMTIHVRFFASLRERLDVADQEHPASAGTTVAEIWQRILGDTAPPANLLVAVNMEYADTQRAGASMATKSRSFRR